MKPGFRIAIVGGGPGGLTLARLLSLGGIDAVVYERDAHPLERPQGGTLDLHEESGLLALARAGLTDAFLAVARYEDQGSRLLDRTGRVLFDDDGVGGNRPEVDRTALRALLLGALPPGAVQWGRTVREVVMAPDGRATLVFEHGTEGPFDLVVGADGAWSRLRPLLSPYQPQYSGLTFIEFGIDDIDRRHPALSRLVGRGKVGVFGGGKAIIAQRNGHAHVRGYAIFRVPLDWVAQRFDFASPDAMRAALVAEFDGCADAIHDLFRASGDRFANRPIVALPVGHCWAHRRGVTLIGDAAHVMSPFGGEGVNNAMRDAAELAAGLIAHADRDTAVAAFEQQMFVRVTESAREAADAAATQLSHDAEALALARYRALHAA
ncbi:FAD-dependent monooxygenase [Burkholderia cenocepacia]|uniref:FAD-dependent oxidoreductase n=1 Tax=Burkholderia cenocepacia TaxID=95486 RepID=UPI000F580A77|nr:NAD(P)/FAD-dependent oxidoreductase [Burkholderia cenocepacia]RQU91411.1 FAD-dependent monooxygenase [Burkholderia cenocepacia]RQV34551.1 FAD-dependent monooxygenase [Burkholderia cenocepacia]RQV37701.1 FAD-dependent monooxygenase [Burkholderia cenocepacia]RQV70271.1 FAD-dependent monooxygenase [Burkholderia cenocepacia]